MEHDYKVKTSKEVFETHEIIGFHRSIFTAVPAWETGLSMKAIGLHIRLLTWSRSQTITVEALVKSCRDGEAAIRTGLKELEEAGYIRRERIKEGGKYVGIKYMVYDVSQTKGLPPKMAECMERQGLHMTQQQQIALPSKVEDADYEQLTIDSLPTMTVNSKDESEKIYEDSPTFDTKNGDYKITEKLYNTLKTTYPDADIDVELQKAATWVKCNPSKKKTKKGMARFLNTWMSNASARTAYKQKGSVHHGYSKNHEGTDYSNAGEFFR